MRKSLQEMLTDYKNTETRLLTIGSPRKELYSPKVEDILLLRVSLHPTSKKSSMAITRRLLMYLKDVEICTANDIYETLGYADKPVMARLKKLKEQGYIRRESKRAYIATRRLKFLVDNYLDKVCGTDEPSEGEAENSGTEE